MSFLLDVQRTHVFRDRGRTQASTHVLHPFLNVKGPHRDRYEVLRTLSAKKKQSAHVSYAELVEMFAHGCFEQFNIRIRMKPRDSIYPTSPPGLHPRHEDIVPGSDFARALAQVNTRASLSPQLKDVLRQLGVDLGKDEKGRESALARSE
jgi:hypothetical protein